MRLVVTLLLLATGSLLAQDPTDVRGWLNRGVQEFKTARYPEARAAFQKAVDLDPANVTPRLYLATAWMQEFIPGVESLDNRATAANAEREFLRVLDLDRTNKLATASIAALYLNQRRWDDAQRWYQKLANVDSGDTAPYYSMGFIAWSRWYPAYNAARSSLGMRLEDPGPFPAGAVKEDLKVRFGTVIQDGIDALRQALVLDPKYNDAMAYMNLLVRERADLRDTPAEYQRDIQEADDWVMKALAAKKEKAEERGSAAANPPAGALGAISGGIRRDQTGGGGGDRLERPSRVEPMVIRKVPPVYPEEARRAHIQGFVNLAIVIGADGRVTDVQFVSGPEALKQAAIDAVRQWVYTPMRVGGTPVSTKTTVIVNFTLQ